MDSSMDKVLTVIVPVYNMEKYIRQCLESLVIGEVLDRIEVLVVLDGSKDGSAEIAYEFVEQYPDTFRIIYKANGGHGSAINTGLMMASGEYVKILDSDVTFFDIESTKARQFGFTLVTKDGLKLACLGDEPYNPSNEIFVRDSDWLMHEAFCLYGEADRFHPYEKHHSTVREACMTAEELAVPNLILYHTEETHLAERKELYTEEGRQFYHGNLCVPDDMESFELKRTLKFPGA